MKKLLLMSASVMAMTMLWGCKPREAPPAAPAKPSAPAAPALPEINAARWLHTEKNPVTLAGLRGKVVVLEFWATWCPPCRASIPHLVALHNKYKGEGVVIVGLTDEDYDQADIGAFVKEMNMTYIVGTGSMTGRDYGVRGIPHAVVIGKDGRKVWDGHPMNRLDEAIETALGRAPAAAGAAAHE